MISKWQLITELSLSFLYLESNLDELTSMFSYLLNLFIIMFGTFCESQLRGNDPDVFVTATQFVHESLN